MNQASPQRNESEFMLRNSGWRGPVDAWGLPDSHFGLHGERGWVKRANWRSDLTYGN